MPKKAFLAPLAVPAVGVSQALQAFARFMVTPIGHVDVTIAVTVTGHAGASSLQWIAKVAYVAAFTMRAGVSSWAGVTNIFFGCSGQ